MTAWAEVSIGDTVVWGGDECVVRAVRPAGPSIRLVLEPVVAEGEAVAKFAVKVKRDDAPEQPRRSMGSAAKKKPGKRAVADAAEGVVKDVLGGKLMATIQDDTIVCPPMDVTLIATHLKVMHGIELLGLPVSTEDDYLRIHEELHGAPFHKPAYPHTHEEPK